MSRGIRREKDTERVPRCGIAVVAVAVLTYVTIRFFSQHTTDLHVVYINNNKDDK